jgi:hypothetical protein
MRNKEGRKDSISKPHPGSSGTLEIVIPQINIVASPDIIEVIEATAIKQLKTCSSTQEMTPASESPIDSLVSSCETRKESKEELQELSAESDSKENRTNESESDRKRGRYDEKDSASNHPISEPPPKRPRKDDSLNQFFITYSKSSLFQASIRTYVENRLSFEEDANTKGEEYNSPPPSPG